MALEGSLAPRELGEPRVTARHAKQLLLLLPSPAGSRPRIPAAFRPRNVYTEGRLAAWGSQGSVMHALPPRHHLQGDRRLERAENRMAFTTKWFA